MGHQHVIAAFARVAADPQTSNVALLLSGYGIADEFQEELRAQVKGLGLTSKVFWLKQIPNEQMPILYAMADVIISYAEVDAFPVTFFEAAACKRPVITSLLPDYAGIFGPDSFLFIPPRDVPALAAAMTTSLMESPEVQAQRLENAFAVARRIGDWQRCFATMENIYNQLVIGG